MATRYYKSSISSLETTGSAARMFSSMISYNVLQYGYAPGIFLSADELRIDGILSILLTYWRGGERIFL